MISESRVAAVFGAVPAGDETTNLVHQARAMIRNGFAVVLCKPGTKIPMCTLSSTEVKRADEEAQLIARSEGATRWASITHPCGFKHALTDEKTSDRVIARLIKSRGRLNLGIELRASRVVVVDVDTEFEMAAFKRDWEQETGSALPYGMTVASPGVYADSGDGNGSWKHKNGGHYWFTLPEGMVLPAIDGALKMPTGWVIMWADRQVLVPPSVRQEGPYKLVGDAHEIPPWLLKKILGHMMERKARAEAKLAADRERVARGDGTASIDVWAASFPWADLLEPDGWVDTGKPSNCGCIEWTAPPAEDHASPKSATAHEPGCSLTGTEGGHSVLHVWTDNPPEFLTGEAASKLSSSGKTFTKLQYVALRDHDGDIREACRAMGIPAEGGGRAPLTPLSPLVAQAAAERRQAVPDPSPGLSQPSEAGALATVTPLEGEQAPLSKYEELIASRMEWERAGKEAKQRIEMEELVADGLVPGSSWAPVDIGPHLDGTVEVVLPSMGMARVDGVHLLYPGREHAVIGEMESGKSWYALACVVAELLAGNMVIYIHFEEVDAAGTVERLMGFGLDRDVIKARFVFVGPEEPVEPKYLRTLTDMSPALVVLDGVNEAMSLLDLGIRDEDGAAGFRRRLVKPFTRAGAAVLSCDHVVKSRESRDRYALGSVHKGNGLSGSQIMLENVEPFGRNQRGRSLVYVTKDRGGQIRQHGHATGLPGKTYMGTLVVDDTAALAPLLERTGPLVSFTPPKAEGAEMGSTEEPAPVHEQHLPKVRYTAELAGYFKQLFEDNPAAGYSKAEAVALFKNLPVSEMATKNPAAATKERDARRKAVERAYLQMVEHGVVVPSQDNLGARIDGKHRWAIHVDRMDVTEGSEDAS